jgi:hypothetical protein
MIRRYTLPKEKLDEIGNMFEVSPRKFFVRIAQQTEVSA